VLIESIRRTTGTWVLRVSFVLAGAMVLLVLGSVDTHVLADDDVEDTLVEEVTTTYTVVDGADYIEVVVEVTITNTKRSSGRYYYYYDQYWLLLPGEATEIVMTSDGKELDYLLDEVARESDLYPGEDLGSILYATIDLPKKLFYNKSRDITVSYRIPGAEPRSFDLSRINPAFVLFPAWAWGDPGLGTVEIVFGPGWEFDVFGSDVQLFFEDGKWVYRATDIEDPFEWYTLVKAHNDAGLAVETVEFPGLTVDILWWPGDDEWNDDISTWIVEGFPLLQQLVGIEVEEENNDLEIVEAAEPEWAGYAGWYDEDQDLIELGEHADPHVLIHELAHLWSNESLFVERWIIEGLADQLAAEVLEQLGLDDETEFGDLSEPQWGVTWAFPLNEWMPPEEAPSLNEAVARSEEYGYNGSWWVIRSLYDEIGVETMTEVIVAADADLIAYKGAGEREILPIPSDWRQLLDLLEEIGGSESVQETFITHVLTDEQKTLLDDRNAARAAYDELLVADGEWETPRAIRQVLGRWRFETATTWIGEAHGVLDMWDEVAATATGMGLTAPDTLQAPYEAMTLHFDEAMALGEEQLQTMAVLAEGRVIVNAERDFYERIGLRDKDPESGLVAADAAFNANSFDEAMEESAQAVALVEDAPRLGRERVKWAAIAAGGAFFLVVILLTLLIIWLVRRRRRKKAARAAAAAESSEAAEPDATDESEASSDPDATDEPEPDEVTEEEPGAADGEDDSGSGG